MNLSMVANPVDHSMNIDCKRSQSPEWDSQSAKKKTRDPTSHRLIEKRRRDRMNTCLQNLSKLIPSDYMRKSRTRMEKTEIVEMAIKRLTELENDRVVSSTQYSDQNVREECARQYYRGFNECLDEMAGYLKRTEPQPGEDVARQLIAHVKQQFESKVSTSSVKSREASRELLSVGRIKLEDERTCSNELKQEPFVYRNVLDVGQSEQSKGSFRCTSGSFSSSSSENNVYGFKKQIKERFQADCELKMDLNGDDGMGSDSGESTVSIGTNKNSNIISRYTPTVNSNYYNNRALAISSAELNKIAPACQPLSTYVDSTVPGLARHPTEPFYIPIRVRLASVARAFANHKPSDHFALVPVSTAAVDCTPPLVTNYC